MANFTSFGTSFGPRGFCLDAEERRTKADEARTAARRLSRLPSAVHVWRDVVKVDALEVLSAVYRDSSAAGSVPVVANPGDLAKRLNLPIETVRYHLSDLIKARALKEEQQLLGFPLYRVMPAPASRDPAAEQARMKADLFRPSPRGDHTSPVVSREDLASRIGIRRRD